MSIMSYSDVFSKSRSNCKTPDHNLTSCAGSNRSRKQSPPPHFPSSPIRAPVQKQHHDAAVAPYLDRRLGPEVHNRLRSRNAPGRPPEVHTVQKPSRSSSELSRGTDIHSKSSRGTLQDMNTSSCAAHAFPTRGLHDAARLW